MSERWAVRWRTLRVSREMSSLLCESATAWAARDAQPVEREEVSLQRRRDRLVLGVVIGLEVRVRERLFDRDALCAVSQFCGRASHFWGQRPGNARETTKSARAQAAGGHRGRPATRWGRADRTVSAS